MWRISATTSSFCNAIPAMSLIAIHDFSIGYRGPPLLDEVSCQIVAGQRIGLLGRNGAGKTTLMRCLVGQVQPDHGRVELAPETKLALLPQGIPRDLAGTSAEVIASALPPVLPEDAWRDQQQIDRIVSRMDLDPDARFELLSSGMKRRVLLARALVTTPDVLLLDEPTNHLDIPAITWLENFLLGWQGTLLFVTHDRVFLRKLATRILEIDRGKLFDWSCDYETFLERKEASLEAEEKQQALFDKKLAQEEVWIRQGIKARRTRNEGRVAALKEMRRARADRRDGPGNVQMQIQDGQRSGNLVIEAKNVSFAHGDLQILSDFSTRIMRGDKVGLIGPNGAGKTTLLRLLLGQIPPQEGQIRHGTNLEIAYFDQLGEQLDEQKTVQDNVADGYDTIQIGGSHQHVVGYLKNFLFSAERARTPVRFLSGGERNRVLLAKLFAKPANVIVMDEPTNDLDAETLELLESRLVEFEGTVLLVSHDREFLNNVVTSSIVYEESGLREYVGGYDDWIRQRSAANSSSKSGSSATKSRADGSNANQGKRSDPEVTGKADGGGPPKTKRRLSYKEQQELAALPARIETFEAELGAIHERMARPDFYQQPGEQIAQETAKLEQLEADLAAAFVRWEELDA
jgi:ABC transport system ATP-binding/permease protein